jgi:hypothetical protein
MSCEQKTPRPLLGAHELAEATLVGKRALCAIFLPCIDGTAAQACISAARHVAFTGEQVDGAGKVVATSGVIEVEVSEHDMAHVARLRIVNVAQAEARIDEDEAGRGFKQ